MRKTIVEIIDELIITHIKLFFTIEKKHEAADRGDLTESGRQGILEDTLNGRRSVLKNALAEELGDDFSEVKVGTQERLQK